MVLEVMCDMNETDHQFHVICGEMADTFKVEKMIHLS